MKIPQKSIGVFSLALFIFFSVEILLWFFFRVDIEPSFSVKSRQKIPGCKEEIIYQRNSLGLRSINFNKLKKDKNVFRILLLGASTTDCATQNLEDIWHSILVKKLNLVFSQQDLKIELGAYARGGSKLFEILQWSENFLHKFKPDLVMTLFGINELTTASVYLRRGDPSFWLKQAKKTFLVHPKIPLPEKYLFPWSQIYRRLHAFRNNRKLKKLIKNARGYNFDVANLELFRRSYRQIPFAFESGFNIVNNPNRILLFSKLLERQVKLAQSLGARVVLLSQPVLHHSQMNVEEKSRLWFVLNTGHSDAKKRFLRLSPKDFLLEMRRFNAAQKDRKSVV